MINNVFTETFNFLTNSLNNISKEKSTSPDKKPSDALKRLIDTVQFIYNKRTVFDTDLKSIRAELVSMKSEASKLRNQISSNNSLIFTTESLIDSLIIEVDNEIIKRETIKKEKERIARETNEKKEKTNVNKIKIFKSAFSGIVEKEMNDFLEKNDIDIINIIQNVEKDVVCITLFYKTK